MELLQKTELQHTAMAHQWLLAGRNGMTDSLFVNLPHPTSGYFHATHPKARSYRFEVSAGQRLDRKGYVF